MSSLDTFLGAPAPRVTHDVTISASRYDSLLVADLSARIAAVIGAAPYWRSKPEAGGVDAALSESTRLAIIIHQRLWSHDAPTDADAAELQQLSARPRLPVCVIRVDDEPIPAWLTRCPVLAVHDANVDEVVEQVRELFPSPFLNRAGAMLEAVREPEPTVVAPVRWGEGRTGYLDQPRAISALRHAFDDLEAELGRRLGTEPGRASNRRERLHCSPGRIVVQIAEVGLSFSWVAARSGSITDGRLLVIEWDGVVAHGRGLGAMRTASPGRERVFQPIASGPGDLHWRSADANAASYSSFDLAALAFAGALLTRADRTERNVDQSSAT